MTDAAADDVALVTVAAAVAPSRNPAAVYLASLGSSQSRSSMAASLRAIARVLVGDRGDAPDFMAVPWHLLRHEHVAAVRARLGKCLDGHARAPASLHRHLQALRGVLKEAWRLGWMTREEYARAVDVGPVRGSRLPAGKAVAAADVTRLFAACDASPMGLRDRAALVLLFAGGLRRSEAVQLLFQDVDVAGRSVRVVGKGNKERVVPLGEAAAILAPWLAHRGPADGPLLQRVLKSGRLGGPLSPSGLYASLAKLGERCGVEISPHNCRHTRITSLLSGGADIALVQRFAGHASVTTTTRYDRRGDDALAEAASRIPTPGLDTSIVPKKS